MGLPKIAVPEYSLILPSNGKEIKYRPFLVKEEKILLIAMESEDEKQIVDATKSVIKSCVFGDFNVDNAPMFDIEYIFLNLRSKSKGEMIDLNYKCPTCEGKIELKVNIDDIKVNKEENHTNKIELDNGLGVVMNYPDISLQSKIDSLGDNQIEKIFQTILMCIDYIYDKEQIYSKKDHTKQEMQDFLESLTDPQFQKISNFFETLPKLKHEVKLHCENKVKGKGKEKKVCNYKENVTLEGLASFFD